MMMKTIRKITIGKIVLFTKIVLCALLVFIVARYVLYGNNFRQYWSYYDVDNKKSVKEEAVIKIDNTVDIYQEFTAKGNLLSQLNVYSVSDEFDSVDISILADNGSIVYSNQLGTNDLSANQWNTIDLGTIKVKKNHEYIVGVKAHGSVNPIICDKGLAPDSFGKCYTPNETIDGKLVIGFHFVNRFMSFGNASKLVCDLLFYIFLVGILAYSIINFDSIIEPIKKVTKLNRMAFVYGLYFAFSAAFLFNPLTNLNVVKFTRSFGAGIIADNDVAKRIANFKMWFVIFAIVFVLVTLTANKFLNRECNTEQKNVKTFLNSFVILAVCLQIIRCFGFFKESLTSGTTFDLTEYAVRFVLILALVYLDLELDRSIPANEFAKLMLIGAAISYPLAIFASIEWESGKPILGIFTIYAVCAIIFGKFGANIVKNTKYKSIISAGVIIFSSFPLMTSVYIELVHVLNQHNLFIILPETNFIVYIAFLVIAFLIVSIVFIEKEYVFVNWKKYSYPMIIIGVAFLSVQIPINRIYVPDVFEAANYSTLISDFLKYGKIPIVENYGGHMLTGVIEGIIYALLNNDYYGAIVSPYMDWIVPILCLLFYYFIKQLLDEDSALFITLCFSFIYYWEYFGLGVIVCFAAAKYVKKNSIANAVLFWGSFIICTLYRLDMGFAFGISALIAIIFSLFIEKKWKSIRQLVITLMGWGLGGIIVWTLVCLRHDINPLRRLIEFVMVSASNNTWAYDGIGDSSRIMFGWYYVVLPFIMLVCLILLFFSRKENVVKNKVLLLTLGISYFVNFSRSLVRHSLVEFTYQIIIWSALIFIAAFVSSYISKRSFLPSLVVLICINSMVSQLDISNPSKLNQACVVPEDILNSWTPSRQDAEKGNVITTWKLLGTYDIKLNRVMLENELQEYVDNFKILNILLKEDETFVDYINKSFLYSVLGRENPVYISQSPLMLSGEFTQREFVKEIENVPIVLMPCDKDNFRISTTLDGIPTAYRNYIVSEYIYRNYVPLCSVNDIYCIWCKTECVSEYSTLLHDFTYQDEYIDRLVNATDIEISNGEIINDEGFMVKSSDEDPFISNLHEIIDLSTYANSNVNILVGYDTDTIGNLEIFYTTDDGENFTTEKEIPINISGKGLAKFSIPITEFTKLRLDTPDYGNTKITSFIITGICKMIDYGYDGPNFVRNDMGEDCVEYISDYHNYELDELPRIWAEYDSKNSVNGNRICALSNCGDYFSFDSNILNNNENGNYLLVTIEYDGFDHNGLIGENDEEMNSVILLGHASDEGFAEKCKYAFTIKEGKHNYLFRCSSDYYWFLKEINAVKFSDDLNLKNIEMYILQGD